MSEADPPSATEETAPVAEPVIEAVETPPEPTPEPPPTPKPPPRMVPVAVVTDLREKKRGLEADNERLQRELAAAKAMLEKGDNAPAKEILPAQRQQQQPPEDVQRAAAELVINRDIANVNETGMREYPGQWNDAVNALTAYGVNNPDFIVDILEIDRANAHKILHDIAQDGERAVQLANMSKARRIAEITKMTINAEPARGADGKFVPTNPKPAEPPKTVSKAPAPPPPVTPSASKEVDGYSDEATEDQFTEKFNRRMKERSEMGRR